MKNSINLLKIGKYFFWGGKRIFFFQSRDLIVTYLKEIFETNVMGNFYER